jgi:hypothetical protein
MQKASTDAAGVREILWTAYHPGSVWEFFALVGILSMVGLIAYDPITQRDLDSEPYLLLALTAIVTFVTYGWFWALVFPGLIAGYRMVELLAPQWLPSQHVTAEEEPKPESKTP